MKQYYYIISAESARRLGVTAFRRGNEELGYLVTSGDLVTAADDIRRDAVQVTEKEAFEFIEQL